MSDIAYRSLATYYIFCFLAFIMVAMNNILALGVSSVLLSLVYVYVIYSYISDTQVHKY